MAFVIGKACIGVKDTACVDACPTDAIHAYPDSPQLYIEPATCIDCAACEPACPVKAIYPGDQVPAAESKFIQINSDFFKSFDKSKSFVYARAGKSAETKEGATEVSGVAETTGQAKWVEKAGWESDWEKYKDVLPDRIEEQKRYGRVRTLFEQEDRYILRFYLPEQTPIHPFAFRYDLPREMCSYELTAEVKGNQALIKGKVKDPNIAKLAGHANSFPDRFSVEYIFSKPVSSVSITPQGKHVVDVIFTKSQIQKAA